MIDDAILSAMHRSFGNSIRRVFIPGFGRHVAFREPNVGEQKTLSKIVLANTESQSVVYGATVALIRKCCLDAEFGKYRFTELERILILANLFSTNFLTKQITIKCPGEGCGATFTKDVRHGEIIRSLERIDASDIVFENSCQMGSLRATINYPSFRKYLGFLEFVEDGNARAADAAKEMDELDRYSALDHAFDALDDLTAPGGGAQKKDDRTASLIAMVAARRSGAKKGASDGKGRLAGNIDLGKADQLMVAQNTNDLYVRKLEWKVPGDDTDYVVTFDDTITFEETERILGGFPASFFVREDGKPMGDFISDELYRRLNMAVPDMTCPKCGRNISKDVQLYDFFIAG